MNIKLFLLGLALPLASLLAQSVTITNATRGNSGYFEVGDSLQLNITGGLGNAPVTYTQIVNGVASGPFSTGVNTTSGGAYQLGPVTVTSGSIGTWSETWYVGGVAATPTISFKVLGNPTVTLTNTTRGGSAFYVGDGLQFDLTGGYPGASVSYDLNLNNAGTGSKMYVDTADSTGAYHLTATITSNPGDAGTNVERWYVTSDYFQATPQISFTVNVGCPSLSASGPKIAWNPMYWSYSGSLASADISAAFSAWNSAQSITPFTQATGSIPHMINIADGTLPPNVYGRETSYSFAGDPGGSPPVAASACYLYESSTCPSMCLNNSKVYLANIIIDSGKMSSGVFGRDVHFMTQATLAHEIGHVMSTDDYTPIDCASTDTTLMSFALIQCGFKVPQSCDTAYQASLYSGTTVYSWASCGPNCSTTACSN